MLKHATNETFNSLINENLVLVDFYATWCGPCKMLTPIIEELANERSSVEFVKADVDELRDIARQYGIMSVPTLILFKNGNIVSQKSGFMPKEILSDWINENI